MVTDEENTWFSRMLYRGYVSSNLLAEEIMRSFKTSFRFKIVSSKTLTEKLKIWFQNLARVRRVHMDSRLCGRA